MIKRKRKAFTIVELVIVIAVIAVLAAVLIPTFSSIIQKANESADIQAVRQMNMALATESAITPPEDIGEVIQILADAGYNAKDKLVPVSSNHGFYWHSDTNLILLAKDSEGAVPTLVYPLDNAALKGAFPTDTNGLQNNEKFFDLEKGFEENSAKAVTELAELLDALAAGGTVQLGASIELSSHVDISADVTIDLNGYTLTLKDTNPGGPSDSILTVVSGSLTVIGTKASSEGIVIDAPVEEDYFTPGILVESGDDNSTPSLTLENVNVVGARYWNIINYGKVSLTNSNITINYGYCLSNEGGDAVIKKCAFKFLPIGDEVNAIYCYGGTVDVCDSKFVEEADSVAYCYQAPIQVEYGKVTLEDVTVTTTDAYTIHVGSSSQVIIKSGTFNNNIFCVGETTAVTIYGGTINDVAFKDITAESDIFDGASFKLTEGEDCWIISKTN